MQEHLTPGMTDGSDRHVPGHERTSGADAQIVVIRRDVVENVGHILGNLFQRMYHLIGRVQEGDAPAAAAEQLTNSTRQLEDFLQLTLDYFSPLDLALQQVPATEVVQSLARQLSETIGGPVRINGKLLVDGRVLVDPGRLARGFALLATQLRVNAGNGDGLELKATAKPPGRTLSLKVGIPERFLVPASSEAAMRWAVAEKFLELHGGALTQQSVASGEVLWEIVLPLQP